MKAARLKSVQIVLYLSFVQGGIISGGETQNEDETKRPPSCTEKYRKLQESTMCTHWESDKLLETGVSTDERIIIVKEHNRHRGEVTPTATNMEKMYWDEEIAKIAQHYANTCPETHDKNEGRRVPDYGVFIGQNLAFGHKDWPSAILGWYKEIKHFEYGKTRNAKVIGHFTQLVRDKAVRVGCGYAKCDIERFRGLIYACNYALGNAADISKPYESGSTCEKCSTKCVDKLCDCGGKLCLNGGTMDVNTCTCSCRKLWTGDECQEKNCPEKDANHCGYESGYPKSYCNKYWKVPQECPYMCGLCEGDGENDLTKDCPTVDPEPCGTQWPPSYCSKYHNVPQKCKIMCNICPEVCPGKNNRYCKNGGSLDQNCKCQCASGFKGGQCNKHVTCPVKSDKWYCKYYTKKNCKKYDNVPKECPYLCGLCKH